MNVRWMRRGAGVALLAGIAAATMLPAASTPHALALTASPLDPVSSAVVSLAAGGAPSAPALPVGNGPAACPAPSLNPVDSDGTKSGVQTLSKAGAPAPMGPQSGPAGTWVQIHGTGLLAPNCWTYIFIGTAQQSLPLPTAAGSVPPAPSSTSIVFAAGGSSTAPQSGIVSVWLAPGGPPNGGVNQPLPAGTTAPSQLPAGSVGTPQQLVFLEPAAISSPQTFKQPELTSLTIPGTGLQAGGLKGASSISYYSGSSVPAAGAPAPTACDIEPASAGSDTVLNGYAPATYCKGDMVVNLIAYRDQANPAAGFTMAASVAGSMDVLPEVAGIIPERAGPGDVILVSGSGFGNGGSARIGGVSSEIRFWFDRVIEIVVPKGAADGHVTLTRGADALPFDAGTFTLMPVAVEGGMGPFGRFATRLAKLPPDQPPPGKFQPAMLIKDIATVKHVVPAPPVPDADFTLGPLQLNAFWLLGIAVLLLAIFLGGVNIGRYVSFRMERKRQREEAKRAEVLNFPRRPQPAAPVAGDAGTIIRLPLHRAGGADGEGVLLGHLLLSRGVLDRHQLRDALRVQRRSGGRLGEILVARGAVHEEQVWSALGSQWGASLTHLEQHWVDPQLVGAVRPSDAIFHGILPLRRTRDALLVAMSDTRDAAARAYAEQRFHARIIGVLATPSAIRRRQEQIWRERLLDDSITILRRENPDASASTLITREQKRFGIGLGVAMLAGAVIFRGSFAIACVAAIILLYALVVSFRTWIIVRGAKYQDVIKVSPEEMDALEDLPVYTILCPLYKEAGVLPQLVKACSELNYPASKLDVKLLLEEDDVETLDVVRDYPLPHFFDIVVVPAEGPRTKPKACNYGLQFARGDYTVIYDAEDIPEPDQLKKALAVFRRSDPSVGCVQAKLNFYNPKQNPLTGWFALEYTSWFDFFLPGLVDRGLPVPLGGSSNHFPTALLRRLYAWDPDNVTEDADLGMRLHRAGYHTLIVDSVTLEEANSDFVNWVRQRSRWGKGYAVSWLVQMRHPRQLLREVGWESFLSIQLTLGGTFGVSVLNLFAWTLTMLWALAQFNFIAYLFPSWIYYLGMLEMLGGNFFFLYMGLWAADHRKSWDLVRLSLAAPAYWVMMSLAMIKAGIQLVTAPTFWEKTVHGLHQTQTGADETAAATVELTGVAAATPAAEVETLPPAAGGHA